MKLTMIKNGPKKGLVPKGHYTKNNVQDSNHVRSR